jgi:hypothetical protein
MLLPPVPRSRRRRGRQKRPAAVLTLVQASYQSAVPSIRLKFDRAVDASGLVGTQVVVADGPVNGLRYDAQGDVTVIDPRTIEIGLVDIESYAGPDVRLTASAGTGIAAVDDGGTWPGVTNLLLPFP